VVLNKSVIRYLLHSSKFLPQRVMARNIEGELSKGGKIFGGLSEKKTNTGKSKG